MEQFFSLLKHSKSFCFDQSPDDILYFISQTSRPSNLDHLLHVTIPRLSKTDNYSTRSYVVDPRNRIRRYNATIHSHFYDLLENLVLKFNLNMFGSVNYLGYKCNVLFSFLNELLNFMDWDRIFNLMERQVEKNKSDLFHYFNDKIVNMQSILDKFDNSKFKFIFYSDSTKQLFSNRTNVSPIHM